MKSIEPVVPAERTSLYTLRSQLTDNNVALSEQVAELKEILNTLTSPLTDGKDISSASINPTGILNLLSETADTQSGLVNELHMLITSIKHVLL